MLNALQSFLLLTFLFSSVFLYSCPIESGGYTQGLADGEWIGEDSWHGFVKNKEDVIDEKVFNEIIDKVVDVYEPVIASLGAKLQVNKDWDNGEVNAYAHRTGKTWHITLLGGLARHKDQTPDGYMVTICHEIGHHIAGYPKKSFAWAANEGQSDYFVTAKCLKAVYENDDNASVITDSMFDLDKPIEAIEKKCQDAYPMDNKAADICTRSVLASQADSNIMADLGREKMPSVNTPSKRVVRKHDHGHPKAQCRLDTELQGALCDKELNILYGTDDYREGYCTRAEGYKLGVRPLCWFSPKQAERESNSLDSWFN